MPKRASRRSPRPLSLLRTRSGLRVVPKFRSEAEERAFWAKHDSVDYVNWDSASVEILPNLKLSTTTISLRLPAALLEEIKVIANKRDVPYQSLMKIFLAEQTARERTRRGK
jgi:predicted DNA binding CopG/RHH family protein